MWNFTGESILNPPQGEAPNNSVSVPLSLYSSSTSTIAYVDFAFFYTRSEILPLILTVDSKRRIRMFVVGESNVVLERFWCLPEARQEVLGDDKGVGGKVRRCSRERFCVVIVFKF